MSIHEVDFDSKGRIRSAVCVDDRIQLHLDKPQEVIVEIDGYPVVTTFHNSPEIMDTKIIGGHPLEPEIFPLTSTILRAESADTVRRVESITSFDDSAILNRVVISDRTYYRTAINDSPLAIKNRGYIWSPDGESVDVYVSPIKKGLKRVGQLFQKTPSIT